MLVFVQKDFFLLMAAGLVLFALQIHSRILPVMAPVHDVTRTAALVLLSLLLAFAKPVLHQVTTVRLARLALSVHTRLLQVTDLVPLAEVNIVVAYLQVLAKMAVIHLVVMVSSVANALWAPPRLQEMKELALHVEKASMLMVVRLVVCLVIQILLRVRPSMLAHVKLATFLPMLMAQSADCARLARPRVRLIGAPALIVARRPTQQHLDLQLVMYVM
jgi:hypothetical protein